MYSKDGQGIMISKIQFSNKNHTKTRAKSVIPQVNYLSQTKADSVSFGANRLEITPIMQDKFAVLHKKVSHFFVAKSNIDSITRSFGRGQKIEISEGNSSRCVIIVCDVIERSKTALSGRRYIIRDTGRVQKQRISGGADAENISFQLVGARPFLENKNEAKRLYAAISSIVNTKIKELNDLPKVPKSLDAIAPEPFRIPVCVRRAPSRPPRYPFQVKPQAQAETQAKPLSENWQSFIATYRKLCKG